MKDGQSRCSRSRPRLKRKIWSKASKSSQSVLRLLRVTSLVICTRDRGPALADCPSQRGGTAQHSGGSHRRRQFSPMGMPRACAGSFPASSMSHEPRAGLSRARTPEFVQAGCISLPLPTMTSKPIPAGPRKSRVPLRIGNIEAFTGLAAGALDTAAQRSFSSPWALGPLLCRSPLTGALKRRSRAGRMSGRSARSQHGLSAIRIRAVSACLTSASAQGLQDAAEDPNFGTGCWQPAERASTNPGPSFFHHHRSDWPGLKRQVRAYMKGP